jgi:Family of unknown function (DUF6624)
MRQRVVGCVLHLLVLVPIIQSCAPSKPAPTTTDSALAERIAGLVDRFVKADDDAATASLLADARALFEREGVPGTAKVGDAAAYGFVLVNMLGQPPEFRLQFFARVQEAAAGQELPADAVVFAEARRRQTDVELRYKAHTPTHPELRDELSRLLKDDQAVREKAGCDLKKMEAADRRTAGPLKAIFDRHGVPTFDMVGVQAAKDFVVMVQHQPPAFREAVLPKLKANVDAGQAEPGSYATVYDRTQRDQGKNQLYGQNFECSSGKALDAAPMDDASHVNARRAEMGLMRLDLYARFLREHSPNICGAP